MFIDCISDLHGYHPELKGGDILLIAGDLTASDKAYQHDAFMEWLIEQDYRYKIYIAGNHDNYLKFRSHEPEAATVHNIIYLNDSGCEVLGLKFWGTPWTPIFKGISLMCSAFTDKDFNLNPYFEKIPNGLDFLITHGPSYLILDQVDVLDNESYDVRSYKKRCGSPSLRKSVERAQPKYHICGHIHEAFGHCLLKTPGHDIKCYNVAVMDGGYQPTNPVTWIEI